MTAYLYRKPGRNDNSRRRTLQVYFFLALLLTLAPASQAQYRRTPVAKPHTTPRAVAVLEVFPNGASRLFPVSLMLEGKFYDASLYGANPAPMALWSETVYEAQKAGAPTGTYTLSGARRGDIWWGEGEWKPSDAGEAKGADKSATSSDKGTADKGKPTLKADNDDERPVLRKPRESEADKQAAPASPAAKPETAKSTTPPGPIIKDRPPEDPDRPTLRRGKPAQMPDAPDTPTMTAIAVKPGEKPSAVYAAISDSGPSETHPFEYIGTEAGLNGFASKMIPIAQSELRKWTTGKRVPPLPASFSFTETSLRAYDVDYSNAPELIFTARYDVPGGWAVPPGAPAKPFSYYITVVGRPNYDGGIDKGFAVATDTNHLDLNPRLELIDAVDADGDGRGELLFRQFDDAGARYAVYRVYGSQLRKLFEGGSGQ